MGNQFSDLGRRIKDPPISWLMKLAIETPGIISLAAGFTDSETLPLKETLAITKRILNDKKLGKTALQYGSTEGDFKLRQLTSNRIKRLDRADNPGYLPERVLITNGSQQLLYILVEALCSQGDIVLLEAPTYFVFLAILQSHNVFARSIKLNPDGIETEFLKSALEDLKKSGKLRRVKFLYSVSYFQNPTSYTTSKEKKEEILKILKFYEKKAGHPIYYIEDAAYRELRFSGEDVPSGLIFNNLNSRVIYAGTYSKPFATGVRVGYAFLPDELFTVVRRIKGNHDFGTANYLQQIMTEALNSGAYDEHLKTISKRYSQKASLMEKAIKQHFDFTIQYQAPRGGLYFWVALSEKMKTGFKSKIFKEALKNNVLYVPGELCYADDPEYKKPKNQLRISFGYAGEYEITEGIKRLSHAIRSVI